MRVEPRSLVRRLTPTATRMLEAGVGRAASAQHYEVLVEHLLQQMLEPDDGDAAAIFLQLDQSRAPLKSRIDKVLAHGKTGNSARPVFNANLWNWIEESWLHASLELGDTRIRTGVMLYTLIKSPGRYTGEHYPELDEISAEQLRNELADALSVTREAVEAAPAVDGTPGARPGGDPSAPAADSALGRFCTNVTGEVRAGRIDPIFGRHREIRQCVDILSRRRKNNPIIVGEPGVGKTALVEGLAHAIVSGDVPSHLAGCEIMALDLGLLQAGASVKGEFENRLKAVISEVKSAAKPVILFIDEAHTIIGAGGQKGGGDAANLLKPALARGELRTIAATTWAEYKKYFEKDAALERRFQPVKVDEPDEDTAVVMLRGLRDLYEKAHQVRIKDEAIVAAVELSHRYIAGRLLPDKAVDLLDTTAARVRVGRQTKPESLVAIEADIAALERTVAAIQRDVDGGDAERVEELEAAKAELAARADERESLETRWQEERSEVEALLAARGETLEAADDADLEGTTREAEAMIAELEALFPKVEGVVADTEVGRAAVEKARAVIDRARQIIASGGEGLREQVDALMRAQRTLRGEDSDRDTMPGADVARARAERDEHLIHLDVDAEAVAQTVSGWTGIPLGSMQRDAVGTVLTLEDHLRERVKGQEPAISAVAEACRMAFAGVRNPDAPVGVFLFVGPSGVGKTETALALADQLYGGERFITQINMSEYQEKHTVSRLIGSPPGYVGYGEGGILTEAVRQRPYSVVLLDECEKADRDVLNLFYQVFDKGEMNDGEGRYINFKNTVCILTSNLATDEIMAAYDREEPPPVDEVVAGIRPILSKHFKPALLARMTIVPYRPIDADTMKLIAGLKLGRLRRVIEDSHGVDTVFSEELVDELARRCTESETGARNVDHILRSTLTPLVATEILEVLARGEELAGVEVGLSPSGDFRVDVDAS